MHNIYLWFLNNDWFTLNNQYIVIIRRYNARYSIFCAIRLLLACIGIPIVGIIQENDKNLSNYPLDMYVVLGVAGLSLIIDLMTFDIRRLAQVNSNDNGVYTEKLLSNHQHHPTNLLPIDETNEDNVEYQIELSPPKQYQQYQPPNTNKSLEMINMAGNHNGNKHIKNNSNDKYDTINTRVTHDTFHTFDSNRLLYEKMNLKITTFAFDALWEVK